MIPKLTQNITYTGMGLGMLSDALTCQVTHEVNGEYELRMTYPTAGEIYDEIQIGRIIWATPDNYTREQGFRIYRITRPLNNVVTIYAQHICYDASGVIVKPFTEGSLTAALSTLPTKCVPSCPFTITSSRTVATQYKLDTPRPLWRVFGGEQGSLLDVYGGEWDFDNLDADLKSRIGADRGVEIRYGKNLTQLEQDVTVEATYAGVYPFWKDDETGTLVTLTEQYIAITGATGDRIMLLDLSGDFDTQPTETQLRDRTNAYITANDPGDPKISWKVNMAILSQSPEYADMALLETVALGDTVHVFYEPMNLNATARAVKLVFNVLTERYDGITLGRVKQNLAKIIVADQAATNNKIEATKSSLERAIDQATSFITNGAGYMRFIYNSSNELQEIVSLEYDDISRTPQNVWRWNNGGFGFSPYGYAGPYTTAIDQSGSITADFITAGTMSAARMRTGLLTDEAGKFSLNLDSGAINMASATITGGSINIETNSSTTDSISLAYNSSAFQYVSANSPNGLRSRRTDLSTGASYSTSYNAASVTMQYKANSSDTMKVRANLSINELSFRTDADIEDARYAQLGITLFNGADSKYAVRVFKNSGSGQMNLYDGTSTTTRSRWDVSGLSFFNSSGTLTASYPADGTYLKYVRTTADDYTLSSGGYAAVTKPNTLSGKKIVSADVYSYTSATGAFAVSGYNSRPQTAYIFGTPGATITDLIIEFWYID